MIWSRSHQVRQSHKNNLVLLTGSNYLSAPGAKHLNYPAKQRDVIESSDQLQQLNRMFSKKNPMSLGQMTAKGHLMQTALVCIKESCVSPPPLQAFNTQFSCAKNRGGTELCLCPWWEMLLDSGRLLGQLLLSHPWRKERTRTNRN